MKRAADEETGPLNPNGTPYHRPTKKLFSSIQSLTAYEHPYAFDHEAYCLSETLDEAHAHKRTDLECENCDREVEVEDIEYENMWKDRLCMTLNMPDPPPMVGHYAGDAFERLPDDLAHLLKSLKRDTRYFIGDSPFAIGRRILYNGMFNTQDKMFWFDTRACFRSYMRAKDDSKNGPLLVRTGRMCRDTWSIVHAFLGGCGWEGCTTTSRNLFLEYESEASKRWRAELSRRVQIMSEFEKDF